MDLTYLTPELKDYYYKDFQRLLDYNQNEFWDIDDGIKDVLIKINSNTLIQTLYSKNYTITPNNFGGDCMSYLKLAFNKEIKNNLNDLFLDFYKLFNHDNSKFFFIADKPTGNSNYQPDSKIQLGCVNNPDYFNITHYHINLIALNIDVHKEFWELLGKRLPTIETIETPNHL